jgi:hypothetical protein
MIHRTWLVPAASSSAVPLRAPSTSAMHQIARTALFFSRLMNTAISRAASLHLIKQFIARFQGHCSLTNARAYRLMGQPPSTDPSVQRSARYSVMHVLGGFFDSLRLGTYGPVDYPAPLAQPCSCRSLDPTASRFRHAEAEVSFHRPNPRTTSPYRQPLAL